MSNPGVKILSTKKIGQSNYIVEDNIGEAIHLHIDNFRYDLSIDEFIEFADKSLNSVREYFPNKFNLELLLKLDPTFLNMISQYLYDVSEIKFEKVKLSDILCQTEDKNGNLVFKNISESRIVKKLMDGQSSYDKYQQENHPFQTNEERLFDVLKKIQNNGYPYDENYIVLFNNQMFIRDGQHRAACLYYLYGDIEVPIMRIIFGNQKITNIHVQKPLSKLFSRIRRAIGKIKRKIKSIFISNKNY